MSQYGLEIWNDRPDAEVDLVFVHGLRGHRVNTWTKNKTTWPRDLLGKDLEKARVFSFGYDSGVVHSNTAEVTQGSLESDARDLCSRLDAERSSDGSETRPLITIAHSLGGLVCAQVIEKTDAGDSISKIARHIKGMIFMGTPFRGATIAGWGDKIRLIYNLVKDTDQNTLNTLRTDSQDCKELRKSFPDIIRKRRGKPDAIGVVFFFERKKTKGVQIVGEDSASYPGVGEILPMRTDHLEICKLDPKDSADAERYKIVKEKILKLIKGETVLQDKAFGNQYIVTINGNAVNVVTGGQQTIGSQAITYNSNSKQESF